MMLVGIIKLDSNSELESNLFESNCLASELISSKNCIDPNKDMLNSVRSVMSIAKKG